MRTFIFFLGLLGWVYFLFLLDTRIWKQEKYCVAKEAPEPIKHHITVHNMPEYSVNCFTYGEAIACVNSFEMNERKLK